MPAVTNDKVRLYYEDADSGTPLIFPHELATKCLVALDCFASVAMAEETRSPPPCEVRGERSSLSRVDSISELVNMHSNNDSLFRLPRPGEQKYALFAEQVPEPPGQIDPQRAAMEVERDRALHLDVDLVAELHEILDGAEVDVRRIVPGRRQVLGARHVTAD
jgi:hypothetical protein